VRDQSKQPIFITSGVRCTLHNQTIGGVKDSAHVPADIGDGEGTVGHAVDIGIENSIDRFVLLKHLLLAGFTRIGVGKKFIHVDTDTRKAQMALWDYYEDAHVA